MFIVTVLLLTYFYVLITVVPDDMATQIRHPGAVVSGVAPQKATSRLIDAVVTHLAAFSAPYLAGIACLLMFRPRFRRWGGAPLHLESPKRSDVSCASPFGRPQRLPPG